MPVLHLRETLYRIGVPAVALVLGVMSLAQFWLMVSTTDALIMGNGIAIGSDFLSLWSAAWLAVTGNAAGAYDSETIRAAHQLAVPANTALTLWHYPPTFLLLLAPFGALPYLPAYGLFSALGLVFWLHLLWKLRPHYTTLILAFGFTPLWVNLLAGQNGYLTALLTGWALLLYGRCPGRAGLLLGLLTFKPQLGLSIPLALLAAKRWPVIGAATLTALLLAAATLPAFGLGTWQAFRADLSAPLEILEGGQIPMTHMTSVFSALWITGLPPVWCYAAQALVALAANLAVLLLWRRENTAFELKGAALVLAMLLTTPHLFNYDLTLLALPLLLLWRHSEREGWQTAERPLLLLGWLGPLLLLPDGEAGTVNLMPLVHLLLLGLTLRRAQLTSH